VSVVATFCWTCEKIESVQRRFSKRFTCCSDLKRLATLGLDRLELLWLCFDLIYVYKILFGMFETDASIFFIARNTSTATRGHSLKLFVPQSRLDVRKYFFSVTGLCTVGTVYRLSQMIFHSINLSSY